MCKALFTSETSTRLDLHVLLIVDVYTKAGMKKSSDKFRRKVYFRLSLFAHSHSHFLSGHSSRPPTSVSTSTPGATTSSATPPSHGPWHQHPGAQGLQSESGQGPSAHGHRRQLSDIANHGPEGACASVR